MSYANCGLPYYIGGVIAEKEKLLVTKPELLRRRFCIDVRTENEVTAIDRAAKKVTVRDLRTNRTYEESYDKLLLSPAPRRSGCRWRETTLRAFSPCGRFPTPLPSTRISGRRG